MEFLRLLPPLGFYPPYLVSSRILSVSKSYIVNPKKISPVPQSIPGEWSLPGGMEPVRVILEVCHPGGINRKKLSILSEYF